MKLVILGVGGMGAITLSKMMAQMAIDRGISAKSNEIHGMAKKGGLVEVQMKIGEGKSGVVLQHQADVVIVFNEEFDEYGEAFLKNGANKILLDKKVIDWFVKNIGSIKYISSFVIGIFLRYQSIFGFDDVVKVIEKMKDKDMNLKAFKEGVEYDF